MDLKDKIYDTLLSLIDMDSVEIIYTEHYTLQGYDKKHHLLLIRDGMYCMCGYERDLKLDTSEIIGGLQKELPLEVEFFI